MVYVTYLYRFMDSSVNKKFPSFLIVSNVIIFYFVNDTGISQFFQYFLSKAARCTNMSIFTASLFRKKLKSYDNWRMILIGKILDVITKSSLYNTYTFSQLISSFHKLSSQAFTPSCSSNTY